MYEALVARDLYLVAGCAAAGVALSRARYPALRHCPGAGRSSRRGAGVRAGRGLANRPGAPESLLGSSLMGFAAIGPLLTPTVRREQFGEFVYAPPMRPHIVGAGRSICGRRSYIRCSSRAGSSIATSKIARVRCRSACSATARFSRLTRRQTSPWFPLGADSLGRDQLARLALGARGCRSGSRSALRSARSSSVRCLAASPVSSVARSTMPSCAWRMCVMALPALVRRARAACVDAARPLDAGSLFDDGHGVGTVGWPWPARGVRAVVAAERVREYAEAARALGASRTRLLLRHLLPAARGFLVVQTTLLVPAFVLAEATLSFVGLGFSEPIPSWGAMLRDAGHGRAIVEAPWLLAPAIGIVLAALAVNLCLGRESVHARATLRTIRR